jgi:iron(III) transport system ATP-binding protein
MNPIVRVHQLRKTFPVRPAPVIALEDVSFSVEPGTFVTLLGPSGSGKSTALRCVAGLEEPDSGTIEIADRTVHSSAAGIRVPTHHRDIGMVFQSYAIWPHMTVFGNVAYPLRSKRLTRDALSAAVQHALELVGLGGLERRRATALSGGQQQRVALARALVGRPALLLLDEPLSSVDAPLRRSLQLELKGLQRELGVTTISVTHDQREAMRMSDEIVVLRAGRVAQQGRPGHLYRHPADRGVAEMLGPTTIVPGRVVSAPDPGSDATRDPGRDDGGPVKVETPLGIVSGRAPAAGLARDDAVTVSIRPEAVALSALAPTAADSSQDPTGIHPMGAESGVVGLAQDVAAVGAWTECLVTVDGLEVQARMPGTVDFARGMLVTVTLDPEGCAILSAADAGGSSAKPTAARARVADSASDASAAGPGLRLRVRRPWR